MIMQQNFPIGISDFKKIIQTKSVFIDKSLFIKDIVDNHAGVILITRPRRFGKTMNMSMLQRFLELDGDVSLFNNLKITEHGDFCEKHQNKYPVIFVSFKDVKAGSWDESFTKLKEVFSILYKEHADLCDGTLLDRHEKEKFEQIRAMTMNNPAELSYALVSLIRYTARKHGIQPILLLDEYDTPIQNAYVCGYYEKMVDFMRTLLGAALKDNKDLGKAVMTGIMRISKESMFSGLNNIRVYTLLNKDYAEYFGFTEEEVRSLLPTSMSIDSIREWYNGYTVGNIQVYNPWSIINCLSNHGEMTPYWLNTSDNLLVHQLISEGGIKLKAKFERLLRGEVLNQVVEENLTFSYLDHNYDAVWTLLLHAGYLNVLSTKIDDRGSLNASIAIPNKEVMILYLQIVEHWFSLSSRDDYQDFLNALASGNVKSFRNQIADYLKHASFFDLNTHTSEQVFHMFMLGLLVGFRGKYEVTSNKEAGDGRYDIMLNPKSSQDRGIILEFKTCKTPEKLESTAQQALIQIEEKKYSAQFKDHIPLMIGIAFCGKEAVSAHYDTDNKVIISKPFVD